jgi:hypothetical protein
VRRHSEGISIETLDNPGWMVTVALADTALETQPFERVEIDRTETDWLRAWVEDEKWHAACGPLNLTEALKTFFLFSGA